MTKYTIPPVDQHLPSLSVAKNSSEPAGHFFVFFLAEVVMSVAEGNDIRRFWSIFEAMVLQNL